MTLPDPRPVPPTKPEEKPSPTPPEHRRSWDEVVEESFPASDAPPTPIRIGSSEHEEEEGKQ